MPIISSIAKKISYMASINKILFRRSLLPNYKGVKLQGIIKKISKY